jgi:diguanylate cyclase (GGDEF)-like protein/PAS domain S-box-containing protein
MDIAAGMPAATRADAQASDLVNAALEGAAVVQRPFSVSGQPETLDGDARMFRLLQGFIGIAALGMAVFVATLYLGFRQPSQLVSVGGLVVMGVALLVGRRRVTQSNLQRSVALTSIGVLVLVVGLAVSGEASPVTAMTSLTALLIAVPYVDGRMLRRLGAAAWLASVVVAALYGLEVAGSGTAGPREAVIQFSGVAINIAIALLAIIHVSARLSSAVERYRNLFSRVPVGMYRTTPGGRFLDVNAAFAHMFGLKDPHEMASFDAADLYADPADRLEFRNAVDRAGVAHAIDYRAKAPDGRVFWIRDSALLVRDTSGRPLYYEGIIEDVTELKMRELRLESRAHLDALTGLANRVVLGEQLEASLAEAAPNRPVALLFFDLDDFKQVNDRFGHAAGDGVLAEAGRRLRQATRELDLVARFGGDEFAVMLVVPSGPVVARAVAKRIVAAFHEPFTIGEERLQLGASVGIAVAESRLAADELVRRADAAMYEAKHAGLTEARVALYRQ